MYKLSIQFQPHSILTHLKSENRVSYRGGVALGFPPPQPNFPPPSHTQTIYQTTILNMLLQQREGRLSNTDVSNDYMLYYNLIRRSFSLKTSKTSSTTISVNRSKNQKKNSGGYPPGPLTVARYARSFPSPQKNPV